MASEAGELWLIPIHVVPMANSLQCVAFLNEMARNVDLTKVEAPEMDKHGPNGGLPTPFAFTPMRRKARVPGKEPYDT